MLPSRLILWLGVLCAPLFGAVSGPSSASSEAELVGRAQALRLGSRPEWRYLLFYIPRWLKSDSSVIDNPPFFFSEDGEDDPQAEAEATIRAFFRPVAASYGELPRHPQCAFPARRRYLERELGAAFPPIPCPEVDDFLKEFESERVSLVFSSSFLNNPASMFGHTFLRFHRKGDRSPLLDPAVNYAAVPTTGNPLFYAILGLFGGFPGRFSMMPYYLKVQEYNNHESRDMWEYELAFSPEQVERLLLSLWEVGPHHANYFYLDENCSYMILALLRIADPALDIAGREPWVVPADTVRTVAEVPGLVKGVHYRHSNLSRFLERYHLLGDRERDLLPELVADTEGRRTTALLARLKGGGGARAIDAALDYVDFREKLATSEEAKEYAGLRVALLKARAAEPEPAPALVTRPESERPDRGHRSMRLGVFGGAGSTERSVTQAEFRPALHDLGASPMGYSELLALAFGETHVRYLPEKRRVYLSRLELASILSLAPLRPLLMPLSWKLNIGWETEPHCRGRDVCRRFRIQGGAGVAIRLGRPLLVYGLLLADLGLGNEPGLGEHAGGGLQSGVVLGIADKWRFTSTLQWLRRFGAIPRSDWSALGELTHTLSTNLELRARGRYFNDKAEAGLALYTYF